MQPEILENYLEKIYAWARVRAFSEEEAEDLAQEITYQAILGLPRLRDESRFEPWLWGVASNCAKAFRRQKGKERALFLYNLPEMELIEEQIPEEEEELYGNLRGKIAMLSKSYREVIMLYYYDGLSTKRIAEKLGLAEGTVTWRLSQARKRLEKECQNMEESALRPIEMRVDIYGSGEYGGMIPFPSEFLKDALAKNILWQCYEKARGVEEIAKICGVPAFYVEDRVKDLLERNALTETANGKYRTDFIIWTDKQGEYCKANGKKALEPIRKDLMEALKTFFERTEEISFESAGRTKEELRYLLGTMAFDRIEQKYSILEYPQIPINYDGYRWRYLGNRETTNERINVGRQVCYPMRDGVPYAHKVYWMKGFGGRNMMSQNEIRACWSTLDSTVHCEKEWMTSALERGFVKRAANGSFAVTVPVFRKEQKEAFDALAEGVFREVAPQYAECVEQFVKGYRNLFPEHLRDDVQRMSRNLIMSFYEVVAQMGREEGILTEMNPEWVCDVLIERQ